MVVFSHHILHAKFHGNQPIGTGEKDLDLFRIIPSGLLVAHFENIGFYIGSSYSKYRLCTGFSIKNIG